MCGKRMSVFWEKYGSLSTSSFSPRLCARQEGQNVGDNLKRMPPKTMALFILPKLRDEDAVRYALPFFRGRTRFEELIRRRDFFAAMP